MSNENNGTTASRLDALDGMCDELDAANPSPEQQQAETAEQAAASEAEQSAKDWGMTMYALGQTFCMIAPELKPIYSEERCLMFGERMTPVAVKYGWNAPSGPEFALATCLLGFAVPTFLAVRARLDALREGKDPTSLLARIGLWWRARRARRAAAAQGQQQEQEGAQHGVQQ